LKTDLSLKAKILIVDDELPIREVMSATLRDEGFLVETAENGDDGLKLLKAFRPQIVFLDIWMPGSLDGIEVLTDAKAKFPEVDFVMISGHGNIETAVKATRLGAWDFIEKPLSMDKILISIQNILNFQSQREEKENLLIYLRKNIALVGESEKYRSIKQMVARLAALDSWILLQGEPGVGKNLLAQNIHYLSARAGKPFIEAKCQNLTEELVEMELFGIEKTDRPGGGRAAKGKLELATGGTLYLSAIETLSMRVQERLLKVLQENQYQKIGAKNFIRVNTRVLVGTSIELEHAVKRGLFHEDLYHLLSVQKIYVPPLRDHKEDIPVLIRHFCDQFSSESGLSFKTFSDNCLEAMMKYDWPGNILELKNFVERIYILTPSDQVDLHDLQFAGLPLVHEKGQIDFATFREARAHFERNFLLKKLNENQGNISKTAEAIGLERSYLHRKIKAHGIEIARGSEENV
jgi:two-component system nitrogen regulation response regulator NtrX